jgi:hypothetical protein
MFAKRFFFASAGLLCLMLAYHLGAVEARAQLQGIESAQFDGDAANLAIGGQLFSMASSGVAYSAALPEPGGVLASAGHDGSFRVLMTNGHSWEKLGAANEWRLVGTLLDQPTPTEKTSWGGLKARYR